MATRDIEQDAQQTRHSRTHRASCVVLPLCHSGGRLLPDTTVISALLHKWQQLQEATGRGAATHRASPRRIVADAKPDALLGGESALGERIVYGCFVRERGAGGALMIRVRSDPCIAEHPRVMFQVV